MGTGCSQPTLPGIGPFSSELILLRGAGEPDIFPRHEPRLRRAIGSAYDLPDEVDDATLLAVTNRWRPYRSWVSVLLRTLPRGGKSPVAGGAGVEGTSRTPHRRSQPVGVAPLRE